MRVARVSAPELLFLPGAEIQLNAVRFTLKNMKKIIILILVVGVLIAGWAVWQNRLGRDNGLMPENGQINDGQTRQILLYYYSPENDKDELGNIMCSPAGLVAVGREIAFTPTPIQDAVNLLIKGELSEAEIAAGIATEFPLEGLALKGANLADGVLTLEFDDPQNKTGGGSCRVGILWAQIEATAKQFDGVNEARFIPEELFQP